MANEFIKITELDPWTTADTDWIPFVDISDTTQSAEWSTKKALKSELKGDKGDTGDTWPQWPQWEQGIQGIQWLQGDKWDKWDTGAQWPQGIQGIQWIQWVAGTDWTDWVSFIWEWTYAWWTTYQVNDVVEYNWSSYICKLESTWNLPTNTTYFDLMAQKGNDWAWSWDMLKSVYDPANWAKQVAFEEDVVPYTGATQDVDLNTFKLNAQSIHAKGTWWAWHLWLKHQSSDITASTSESSLGANSDWNPVWKNDWNAIQKIMLENADITWATKTKITYDAKWLVTAWADATTADIADSTNKRYVTDAQLAVLWNTSWTNSWNETASSIATINHWATVKSSIVDADEITGQDSANSFSLIRTTWTSIKAFLKTYFDTLYAWISWDTTHVFWASTIELWHASDTTLSRSSAWVIAVEWVVIPSISSTNTLTNKTMTWATNTLTASLLKSATTEINVSSATAPTTWQVLTATSPTTATWQTPSGGWWVSNLISSFTAWESISSLWRALYISKWTWWRTAGRVYLASSLLTTYTDMASFVWFSASIQTTVWWSVQVTTDWVDNNQSWLNQWLIYLTDTPWVVWNNAGSNNIKIWRAISSSSVLIQNLEYFKILAGTDITLVFDTTTENTENNTSYTVATKTISWIPAWTYTVSYEYQHNSNLFSSFFRLYKNWSPIWTERSASNTWFVNWSENFTFAAWDLIQLYTKVSVTWNLGSCRNFQVQCKILDTKWLELSWVVS